MSDIEKEARIRLMMEKLRKEEESSRAQRLQQEKSLQEQERQRELELQISNEAKSRIFQEKINRYFNGSSTETLKKSDWLNIITEINELFFTELLHARSIDEYTHYQVMNTRIAEHILKELNFTFADIIYKRSNTYKSKDSIPVIKNQTKCGLTLGYFNKRDYSDYKNYEFSAYDDDFPVIKSFIKEIDEVLRRSLYIHRNSLNLIKNSLVKYLEKEQSVKIDFLSF